MKNGHRNYLLLISMMTATLSVLSCGKENIEPSNVSDYWGCWQEATGKTNVYDILLRGNGKELHNFTLGFDCGNVNVVASLDVGFFRNDTLVLDNGTYEFKCYLQSDTLFYLTEIKGFKTIVERLVKK